MIVLSCYTRDWTSSLTRHHICHVESGTEISHNIYWYQHSNKLFVLRRLTYYWSWKYPKLWFIVRGLGQKPFWLESAGGRYHIYIVSFLIDPNRYPNRLIRQRPLWRLLDSGIQHQVSDNSLAVIELEISITQILEPSQLVVYHTKPSH